MSAHRTYSTGLVSRPRGDAESRAPMCLIGSADGPSHRHLFRIDQTPEYRSSEEINDILSRSRDVCVGYPSGPSPYLVRTKNDPLGRPDPPFFLSLLQGTSLQQVRCVRGPHGPPLHIRGELRRGGQPQTVSPPASLLGRLRCLRKRPLLSPRRRG